MRLGETTDFWFTANTLGRRVKLIDFNAEKGVK